MSNTSLLRYRESQITSTSPEKTVLLLFEGAIGFLNSAIVEVEEHNNIPEKAILLEKTVKILDYLQSCLDEEKGGVIAKNLNKLYDYMSIRLTEANLRNDTSKMKEVIGLLSTIRDGWNGICDKNCAKGEKVQPATKRANGSGGGDEELITERKVGIKI
jgi:flagellar protein FliS